MEKVGRSWRDLRGGREFQDEGGALAGAVAETAEGAAQLPGGDGAAVQAKAVAVGAGGEAVFEDAGQVFGWNADTIVRDGNLDEAILSRAGAEDHFFVGVAAFVAAIFGVSNEIDEDLEDLVFVNKNRGGGGVLADDVDLVAFDGAGVEAEGVLDQFLGGKGFLRAGNPGVGLLHGDDLLDMVDVGAE